MKKIDIRVYIIIVLTIILAVMMAFYFKDSSTSGFDFSSFRNSQKSSSQTESVSITASTQERKLLEKEVLLMTEGKIKNEPEKIKRYLQLTSQIKGSGKK